MGRVEPSDWATKSSTDIGVFRAHPYEAKSFYGEIPREWCFREYETESGPHSQLQVWKNFALVNLYLNAPKSPAVFVVAASGASNAQVAACEPTRMDPVAYPGEQFWAVVFAGRGGSGPTQYLLDRATVDKNSARILVSHPPVSYSTADVHEYWFFIPLGRINEGDYPIEVRLAKDDSLIASAKSKLRYATEVEVDQRNTASSARWLLQIDISKNCGVKNANMELNCNYGWIVWPSL